MSGNSVMQAIGQVENLPTLPIIVNQIQKLIGSQRSSMAQIAAVIAKDQAISARVIRLINSAYYGLSSKVSSIQQAIVLLGLNTVKNLVVGVSVVKAFEDRGGASLFDREKFWVHTFATALGAKLMAKQLKREEPEDYFLAGLLHDLGILVLDQFVHEEFVGVLKYVVSNEMDYNDAEKVRLGLTHGEVGEVLGNQWKMPPMLAHSIRHHHEPVFADPQIAPSADHIAVVHLADVASNMHGMHMGYRNRMSGYNDSALQRTGLSERSIDGIYETVEKEVKNLTKEWGI